MEMIETRPVLTHKAVMKMLAAAVAKAEEIGQPQCIVIVDAGGDVLGEIRMTGSKFLSRRSALAKALTAASNRTPSDNVPEAVRAAIAAATDGAVTGLTGGLPITTDGHVVGGVGVGSGAPDQDIAVAKAALSVLD